ncbi:hypothetical protein Cfor_00104 [Coptotermes formosanus]|jgi:hypothetical protein|uniref:Nucleoporin NUP42 n=1 Tax=Coptotermes formosanus TaxID=36987 RepID=A0A6L2PQK8_COPFO|nr:hypothetical protein Cfor_00104 [Coptotermes formosanus]
MVICKYYQQGMCKFGSSCRYEHTRSDYSASGESVLRGRYGGHQYATNDYYNGHGRNPGSYKFGNTSHDFEEIMQMVIQEVVQSEKGGQWPLSCFAPIKERSCFPGWEDVSPEEVRWKMYESVQDGTLPEYQRQLKELYDAAKLQRQQIMNPNNEVFKIIEKLLRGEKIETEKNFSFLQAATQMRDNNMLSLSSSSFGTSQQQNPASSNFVFSLPQLGGSSGQTTVQQQSSGFYNGVQVAPNIGMQSVNVCSGWPEMHTPFSAVTQDSSSFQSSSHTALSSGTAFGGNRSVVSSVTGNKSENTVAHSCLYSSQAELSQEELNAYLASTFTMGKVPTKPPPKELCNL